MTADISSPLLLALLSWLAFKLSQLIDAEMKNESIRVALLQGGRGNSRALGLDDDDFNELLSTRVEAAVHELKSSPPGNTGTNQWGRGSAR